MLYLKKSRIYTSLQDDLPLKKPWKPSAMFDFININLSSRRFLHVQGLVLVFILKELPIGTTQTISFFALAYQNCRYISTTYGQVLLFRRQKSQKVASFVEYETNVSCGEVCSENARCFFDWKDKIVPSTKFNCERQSRKIPLPCER